MRRIGFKRILCLIPLGLAFLGIGAGWSPYAQASPGELRTRCASRELPWHHHVETLRYCIHRTEGSSNRDILYFLHGLEQNERDWVTKPKYELVRQEWRRKGFDAPIVVTVSFGPIWILAPETEKEESGLYELFFREVLPLIELYEVPEFSGQRQLVGMSMGGLNALELSARNPDLFTRVALLCPAAYSFPIFPRTDWPQDLPGFESGILREASHSGASALTLQLWVSQAQVYFTRDTWDQYAPLALSRRLMTQSFPPLYVSAIENDPFGLLPSDWELYRAAASRGVRARWRKLRGEHCDIDSAELAAFLAN